VTLVAGQLGGHTADAPAPDSWAADPVNNVAIWLIRMDADARWILPAAPQGINRMLYFFEGAAMAVDDVDVPTYHGVELDATREVALRNGPDTARLLVLQGRPIAEPVAQYGPFVMNTQGEILQAFEDYRRTRFGGWPWDRPDPVHGRTQGRFARYADGRVEIPRTLGEDATRS
jgi:quercetin 2,3-dioxygenase